MLKRFLFPVKPDGTFISVILLIVRVVFGVMLMNHGIDKWANYQELSAVFLAMITQCIISNMLMLVFTAFTTKCVKQALHLVIIVKLISQRLQAKWN